MNRKAFIQKSSAAAALLGLGAFPLEAFAAGDLQKITILHTNDQHSRIDPFPMDGGIAVTEVPRLRDLLSVIVRNGFEHHVAMVRGSYASVVDEAVSRYLGWQNYHHEAVPRFAPPAPFTR